MSKNKDRSNFASNFAPYTPPPDEPRASLAPGLPGTLSQGKLPWLSGPGSQQTQAGSTYQSGSSYQSGGVPTFGTAVAGGLGAEEEVDTLAQVWETRYGWRVDVCAALAYLGGPLTALIFLILETSNDFVRFHAYQSALLTTPLLLIRIFLSFIFPSWLQTILTILFLCTAVGMAIRAYRDASQNGLVRHELPYIGEMANRWVKEE